ncbi:MAG: amidohydrolase family protein, partial [Schwartzia sp.]|nr:amidohydrolase family protein [Schwartzia sp. (in: firmicutes)]
GLDKEIGALESGKHADITIFDEKIRIKKTIVGGQVVFG